MTDGTCPWCGSPQKPLVRLFAEARQAHEAVVDELATALGLTVLG